MKHFKLLTLLFFVMIINGEIKAQYAAPATASWGWFWPPNLNNVVVGNYAGRSLAIGAHNSIFGYESGSSLQSGHSNSFFGYQAGKSDTIGYENCFFGKYSGLKNIIGFGNCFYGFRSGENNIQGRENVFVGSKAGIGNTKGDNNVFAGTNSGAGNATGFNNIYIGHSSAAFSNSGYENVYIGTQVGLNANSTNSTVFIGSQAGSGGGGSSAPSGGDNVGVGYFAGKYIESGKQNTYLGSRAGEYITSSNTFNGSVYNSSAIGYSARFSNSNEMSFGNTSVLGWYFGRTSLNSFVNSAGSTVYPAFQVGTSSSNGNGAALSQGGIWENASDVHLKTNIQNMDGKSILEKINQLKVTRWMYTGTNDEYHIGPMAQDFYQLFQVGSCNTRIGTVDPAGVALIGIQQLSKENELLKKEITDLKTELRAIKNTQTSLYAGGIKLYQNNPNPFNEVTTINYYIPTGVTAQCIIYDMTGAKVAQHQLLGAGEGSLRIQAGDLRPGSYIYTISSNDQVIDSKVMLLVKN